MITSNVVFVIQTKYLGLSPKPARAGLHGRPCAAACAHERCTVSKLTAGAACIARAAGTGSGTLAAAAIDALTVGECGDGAGRVDARLAAAVLDSSGGRGARGRARGAGGGWGQAGSGVESRDRPAGPAWAGVGGAWDGARRERLAAPDAPAPMQGGTPLHLAAENGKAEAVKVLADLGAAVDARDVSGGKGRGREARDRRGVGREGTRGSAAADAAAGGAAAERVRCR